MRGPEEWPSSGSNPADRIRLTGPAANNFPLFREMTSLECLPFRSSKGSLVSRPGQELILVASNMMLSAFETQASSGAIEGSNLSLTREANPV